MAEKSRNADRWLSFAAMFVSLVTLVVFIYQTKLIRKQQYMSVYPHLAMGHSGSNSSNYRLLLLNQGIGPALIHSVTLKYNGKVLEQSLSDYVVERINLDSVSFHNSDLYAGRLIPAEEVIELIAVNDGKWTSSKAIQEVILNDSLDFEIIYESIYGEQWRIDGVSPIPEKLN